MRAILSLPSVRLRFACWLAGMLTAAGTACANELVIGQVAPFSGPLSRTGTELRAGAQLYFDAVNAAGGIHGAKLKLVSRDDGYMAAKTVIEAQALLDKVQPLTFFGFVGTAGMEALLKAGVLEDAGIPLVAARTGGSAVLSRFNSPYLFITRASHGAEVVKIVETLVAAGHRRLAVFYQDDAFGRDGLTQAEWTIRRMDATLAASASYEKNTTNVEGAVKAIVAAAPHAVVMLSNTDASAEFVRQFRAAGNKAQLAAVSDTDGIAVAQLIGNATAAGLAVAQVVPDPNNTTIPIVQQMQRHAKQYLPQAAIVTHTMLEGYIGAFVLVEALRNAGKHPTRKKLQEALASLKEYDAGGVRVSFGEGNNFGVQYLDITILNREGRLLR